LGTRGKIREREKKYLYDEWAFDTVYCLFTVGGEIMKTKKIENYLPKDVIEIIRDYFEEKVSNAEKNFEYHEEDEDSITGALGQELITKEPISYQNYSLNISSRKIRGRGKNAPERLTGADGIFKITILEGNNVIFKKGLLFQSKKNWKNRDKNLIEQCKNMIGIGSSIVINYTEHGYETYDAKDVITEDGNRKSLQVNNKKSSLGQLLGNDFLNCVIGKIGLDYDKKSEQFLIDSPYNSTEIETQINIERR